MAISALPQPGHRGIDSRDTFVTKQEAFQDALYNNFVDEANTLAQDVNTKHSEIVDNAEQVATDKVEVEAMHAEVLGASSALPDGIINDNTVTNLDTWSSSKLNSMFSDVFGASSESITLSANLDIITFASRQYFVNATLPFLEIKLPDASTLTDGYSVFFRHVSGYSFIIRDFSGKLIANVGAKGGAYLSLASNSSSSGVWTVNMLGAADVTNSFTNSVNLISSATASPYVYGKKYNADGKLLISSIDKIGAYVTSSSTVNSIPSIAGNIEYLNLFTPISCAVSKSSSEVIVFSLSTSHNIATYSIDTTTGAGSNVKDHGVTPSSSTYTSATLLDANTVLLSTGTHLYIVDITNSANIVIGSAVAVSGASGIHSIAIESSTKAMVTYKHTDSFYKAVMITISGTSISFGTPVQIGTISPASNIEVSLCWIDTGKYVFSYKGTDTYAYAVVLSESSDVITVNTPVVLSGTTATNITNIIRNSSSQCIVVYNKTTALVARVLSISGTTITANTEYTMLASGASTAVGNIISMISNNLYILTYSNNISIVIAVSGTTLSFGTAYTSNMPGMVAKLNHVESALSIVQIGFSSAQTTIHRACIANGMILVGTTLSNGVVRKVAMFSNSSYRPCYQIIYNEVDSYSLALIKTGYNGYFSIAKIGHTADVHSLLGIVEITQTLTDARIVKLATDKYMIIGYSGGHYIYSALITVSGNSITIGTFYQSTVFSSITNMHACSYDSTRGIVTISYSGNTVVIAIKETSGIISYGSAYSVGMSAGSSISVINTTYGVLAILGGTYSKLFSLSDTTLSVLNSVTSSSVVNTYEYTEFASGFIGVPSIGDTTSIQAAYYLTFDGTTVTHTGVMGYPYSNVIEARGTSIQGAASSYLQISHKEATTWI